MSPKSLIALGLTAASAVALRAESPAPAPTAAPVEKPKAPWELEWDYFSKYHDANLALGPAAAGKPRIVFMGDSITEGWGGADPSYFVNGGYVNRGISGQTTSQMLVRFRQDVINLKPAVVVILGGTNDIAENGGKTTLEAVEENLQSMAELARANGIRVVLSSVLPAYDYPWRMGLAPADKIVALNSWIASYCAQNAITYLDYFPATSDSRRGMKAELSGDGVHPNAAGYAVMEPLATKAIAAALK